MEDKVILGSYTDATLKKAEEEVRGLVIGKTIINFIMSRDGTVPLFKLIVQDYLGYLQTVTFRFDTEKVQ